MLAGAILVMSAVLAAGCGGVRAAGPNAVKTVAAHGASGIHAPAVPAAASGAAARSAASHRPTISATALNTLLQHAFIPAANHWRVLSGGKAAMQFQGVISPTARVVVTVDLYTGRVLRQEGPQGVSGAVAVVKGFYAALADGNPEAAWIMLNPTVYNPNPSFFYPQTYAEFMSDNRSPGSPVKRITTAHWSSPGPGWKYLACECYLFGGDQRSPGGFVRVEGTLDSGQQFDAEVIRGGSGTWSLLWNWQQKALADS